MRTRTSPVRGEDSCSHVRDHMAMERTRRAGMLGLGVLGVAFLLLVVALASRPEGGGTGPRLDGDASRVVLDTAFYLALMLGLLSLGVAVWALWPRPDEESPPIQRRRWSGSMAVAIAFAIVALVW